MTADKDALLMAVAEFEEFINEPPAYENRLTVRDYRHSVYARWDDLRARITAALAEKDEGGWMPIETAPKDQKIMTACPDGSINAPAFWYPDKYAKKPRPYWTSNAEYLWGKAASRANQPTHWRPLPPLPKERSE